MLKTRPRIFCNDGFSLSVQASRDHYSIPRNNEGPYTHVEVGFPSESDALLTPFAEDDEELTGTVYGYVPVDIVSAVIAKHGGIVKGFMP